MRWAFSSMRNPTRSPFSRTPSKSRTRFGSVNCALLLKGAVSNFSILFSFFLYCKDTRSLGKCQDRRRGLLLEPAPEELPALAGQPLGAGGGVQRGTGRILVRRCGCSMALGFLRIMEQTAIEEGQPGMHVRSLLERQGALIGLGGPRVLVGGQVHIS